MNKIYLDDQRTPEEAGWIVVRNYQEFVETISKLGIENIEEISFDHDLSDCAMSEYFNNVVKNFTIDYSNIYEKTGLDCAKWLVDHWYDKNPEALKINRLDKKQDDLKFPKTFVHSHNPVGGHNICAYLECFFRNERSKNLCPIRKIPFKVD